MRAGRCCRRGKEGKEEKGGIGLISFSPTGQREEEGKKRGSRPFHIFRRKRKKERCTSREEDGALYAALHHRRERERKKKKKQKGDSCSRLIVLEKEKEGRRAHE